MRLFRHSKAIALVLGVCLLMGLVPGSRFAAAARAEEIVTLEKTINGFGTSALQNPSTADGTDFWRGDYVYFGTYDGKPIRFRVLSTSTTDFGGTTMLLESEAVLAFGQIFGGTRTNPVNVWLNSDLRTYLNGTFLQGSFTLGEQGAIASSTKAAMTGSDERNGATTKHYEFAQLSNDKIFVLDIAEIANAQYGYRPGVGETDGDKYPRHRLDTARYWLRSANNNGVTNAVVVQLGTRALDSQDPYRADAGACPALNINPSSILFLSLVEEASTYSHAAYKMTLKDSGKSIWVPSGQAVTYSTDGVVMVPYTYTDTTTVDAQKVNRISWLITREALTDNNNPTVLYYGELGNIRDAQGNASTAASAQTGSGAFTLPEALRNQTLSQNYHLYILPEHVNETTRQNKTYVFEKLPHGDADTKEMIVSCATDYAGSPVEITSMIPAHEHSFVYEHSSNQAIIAWCTSTEQANQCSYQADSSTLELALTAPSKTYDGNAYARATVTNNISAVTGAQPGTLTYQGTGSTSYGPSESAPTDAGTYRASITLGGKTAVCAFTIQKAAPICTPPAGLQPVYTGSALALISAGSATGGRMEYSLDGQT